MKYLDNDYLNMSHNESVIEEMIEVIKKVGTGSGGTRNISGTTPYHQNLEKSIANFHKKESALIFTSAYVANQTSIWTICKAFKNICVFSGWYRDPIICNLIGSIFLNIFFRL